jgi:hypothetical protein
MRPSLHILAVTSACIVSACSLGTSALVRPYPDNWPRLASTTDCAALAGNYNMRGNVAIPSEREAFVPSVFGLFGRPVSADSQHASLALSKDQSTLSLTAAGAEKLQIATESVVCKQGSLVRTEEREANGDGTSLRWKSTVTLSKATDGSLIAHSQGSYQSADLFFRSTREVDAWYRYLPQSGS